MKFLIFISLFLVSCTGTSNVQLNKDSHLQFKCENLENGYERCYNSEVICYHGLYSGVLSCIPQGLQENRD